MRVRELEALLAEFPHKDAHLIVQESSNDLCCPVLEAGLSVVEWYDDGSMQYNGRVSDWDDTLPALENEPPEPSSGKTANVMVFVLNARPLWDKALVE